MTFPSPLPPLTLLKLGGSLITDKNCPHTPRLDVLARLAGEIASARRIQPDLRLLLGHGSGSFGHVPAKKYGTRQGVHTSTEWLGFMDVWREAAALNRLVVDALATAGLPALSFPPSAAVIAADGQAVSWDMAPLLAALDAGLLPVVYGDVVFDRTLGGTILSTEDLFTHLAPRLRPTRILLAGLEAGVWADYPACTRLIPEITPANHAQLDAALGGSYATDVTGGMASKVRLALDWAQAVPGLEVRIFSAADPGSLLSALLGEPLGTRVTAAISTGSL
jgi:isopentenyl phosphate kinase